MAQHITIINQVGHYTGWHTARSFRRYHRRFHRPLYWLSGAFLIEAGFWMGIIGLMLSLGLLFLLASAMLHVLKEANR
jgi:hypothetical protein